MDNLSEHNQFCSSILHFWSAIKNLISAELHAHVHKRVSQNYNTTREVWVWGYHMAILLANVRHNILLWREILQRPPVNSQSSKGKWSTKRNVPEMGGAIWSRVPGGNMAWLRDSLAVKPRYCLAIASFPGPAQLSVDRLFFMRRCRDKHLLAV